MPVEVPLSDFIVGARSTYLNSMLAWYRKLSEGEYFLILHNVGAFSSTLFATYLLSCVVSVVRHASASFTGRGSRPVVCQGSVLLRRVLDRPARKSV